MNLKATHPAGRRLLLLAAAWSLGSSPALAQPGFPAEAAPAAPAASPIIRPGGAPATPPPPVGADSLSRSLNFPASPIDMVLDEYGRMVGKTLIKDPKVAAITITLKSRGMLTNAEAIEAIETALAMNNITFVPQGDKFLKVVPSDAARREGHEIGIQSPTGGLRESSALVSQVIDLQYMDLAEIQPVVQELMHAYGKLQLLERTNSLLIMDTAANVKRILEIVDYLDKPAEVKDVVKIYELSYAEAGEVASRLNELIAESQAELAKSGSRSRVGSSTSTLRTPAGVIRPGSSRTSSRVPTPTSPSSTSSEMAQQGLVSGKVLIVPDERTNILIIISREENDKFFEEMIATLDRQVDPDIGVQVIPLEFADAEEIASTLNDLIGAASGDKSSSASTSNRDSGSTNRRPGENLQEYVKRRNAASTPTKTKTTQSSDASGNIGQISENTKILPDIRTNSLLIMGKSEDVELLKTVINQLDVMLAQVLIEAVILEIQLTDNVEYGFDWLQRSMTVVNEERLGPNGGISVSEPIFGFGGGSRTGSDSSFIDGGSVDRNVALTPGAMSYFGTFYDLNLDVILKAAAGSSDAKVRSTPVIMTTDNTEAKITVGERRPIPTTSSTTVGGTIRSTYEYEDIGIELVVTPRINPQQVVVMEIAQSADNVGGSVTIDGNDVPIITTRQMEASIAIEHGTTLVLGGLVSEDDREVVTKVPILGDIPLLGALFRSKRTDKNRTEILVLITPYVLMSTEDAVRETKRLHGATRASGEDWYRGWSASELAEEKAQKPLRRFPNPFRRDPKTGEPVEETPATKPVKTIRLGRDVLTDTAEGEAPVPMGSTREATPPADSSRVKARVTADGVIVPPARQETPEETAARRERTRERAAELLKRARAERAEAKASASE